MPQCQCCHARCCTDLSWLEHLHVCDKRMQIEVNQHLLARLHVYNYAMHVMTCDHSTSCKHAYAHMHVQTACMYKLCKLDIARGSPLHMDLCCTHDINSVAIMCRTSVETSVDKQAVQFHPYYSTTLALCCAVLWKKYAPCTCLCCAAYSWTDLGLGCYRFLRRAVLKLPTCSSPWHVEERGCNNAKCWDVHGQTRHANTPTGAAERRLLPACPHSVQSSTDTYTATPDHDDELLTGLRRTVQCSKIKPCIHQLCGESTAFECCTQEPRLQLNTFVAFLSRCQRGGIITY